MNGQYVECIICNRFEICLGYAKDYLLEFNNGKTIYGVDDKVEMNISLKN